MLMSIGDCWLPEQLSPHLLGPREELEGQYHVRCAFPCKKGAKVGVGLIFSLVLNIGFFQGYV